VCVYIRRDIYPLLEILRFSCWSPCACVCKQECLEFPCLEIPCLYRPSLFIGIPYLVLESGVESGVAFPLEISILVL
jgi:hypothetical protein